MQALCLNVRVLNESGQEVEIRELDEDAFRTTESLGIDLFAAGARHREEDEQQRRREPPARSTYLTPPTTRTRTHENANVGEVGTVLDVNDSHSCRSPWRPRTRSARGRTAR